MAEIDRLKKHLDDVQNEDGFLVESLKTHSIDLERQCDELRAIALSNSDVGCRGNGELEHCDGRW